MKQNKQAVTAPKNCAEFSSEWLAYELHDGLLQWIVSAKINVEHVAIQLQELTGVKDSTVQQLSMTQRFLEFALEEGRQLIQFLEDQASVQTSGLEWELVKFTELVKPRVELAKQNLRIEASEETWPDLEVRTRWNVLRVMQQAITNAIQYAGACDIRIAYRLLENGLYQFRVADSGVGFDLKSHKPQANHFGLSGMRHRADMIGAKLDLQSALGTGTIVSLTVPGSKS